MIALYASAGAVLLGGFLGWQAHSYKTRADERDKVVAEAKYQQETARSTFRLQEARDAENIRTGDLLADALQRLRDRPAVRLVETPAACAGSSPAAISAEDAAVALRLAAEADRLRADYEACRGWVESVTR